MLDLHVFILSSAGAASLNLVQIFLEAVRAMSMNRLRTGLTMQAIIIGVGGRGGIDAGHRRIGVRRHLPAHCRDARLQFLSETFVICVCGGVIGVALAYGTSALITRFSPTQVAISLTGIVIAFSFSAMIGVFFGVYLAKRAAGLRPVGVLRYE